MTTVGTSVAAMPSSILSSLGDGGPARSNGAGSSFDGGFDALFSRALEVDDTSAVPGREAEQAPAPLDRRGGVDRADRAAVGDERRTAAVDEPVDRSLDRADHAADRTADAATTDEVDEIDRPTRSAPDNGSPDQAAGVAPFTVLVPVVPTPAVAVSATPTLVPGAESSVSAVDASAAQNDGVVPTATATAPATAVATPPLAAAPSVGADAAAVGAVADAQQSLAALDAIAQAVATTDPAVGTAAPVDTAVSAAATAGGMPPAEAPLLDTRASAVRQTLSAADSPAATPSVAAATVAVSAVSGADAAADAVIDADAVGSTDTGRPTVSSTGSLTASPNSSTSASGTQASPGTQAGTGTTPTGELRTTTATPERVTELQRMRERAALTGVANGAMSVDLSDEGLGPLTLHALQSAAGVHLTLSAADQATRDLLASQGSALRNELESAGTALGSLDIRHTGAGSSGDRGAGPAPGRVGRADAARAAVERSSSSSLTAVRPRSTPSTDGVDLLI